ncbi:hypothetical protein CYMTET_23626 [Cymbomonas tetramitiformis]|uniref:Uncharacterized protein n=1 Tax=Cymbomonas tetramitiformis TaxID=36881 RepID=A0AAE0L0S1_9CHLO|nr:hypothetical protein CYMTET_23626 [Cymbomonas tetramitiformis]
MSDFENDMLYAGQFQYAVKEGDSDKFNARCFLVGGEPEMCDEISAYSFGVTTGGASDGVPSFATVKIDGVRVGTDEPPPPPPLSDDGTDGDAADRVYPAADSVHFDDQTFADIIARGPLAVQHEELHLQNAWMIDDDDDHNNELLDGSESDEEGDTETVHDCFATGLLNGGESDEDDDTETVSDAPRSVVPRHGGDAMTAAIPPRKQARYRQEKQGFYRYRVVPLPLALQDPDPLVPDSPPYSPPPYTSDEEEEASTDDFSIENPSISSTNDVPATSQLPFGCPENMLRAGPTIPPPESG